jgi:putative sterol carrier protein
MNHTMRALQSAIPRLNENKAARNLMEAFPRTVQLNLEGEARPLHLVIAGGRMELREGAALSADIVVVGETAEFARVVNGELDVSHPIAHGKLRVEKGKVSDMTLLTRILWSTKRGAA